MKKIIARTILVIMGLGWLYWWLKSPAEIFGWGEVILGVSFLLLVGTIAVKIMFVLLDWAFNDY